MEEAFKEKLKTTARGLFLAHLEFFKKRREKGQERNKKIQEIFTEPKDLSFQIVKWPA